MTEARINDREQKVQHSFLIERKIAERHIHSHQPVHTVAPSSKQYDPHSVVAKNINSK